MTERRPFGSRAPGPSPASTARGSLLLVLGLALLLSGCGKPERPADLAARNQELIRNLGQDVTDLDPGLASQSADYSVLSALFEGLVGEDPVDLHPVPAAAESWDVSPDGLTYTFHLRASALWSDGAPVTARDFITSWHRVLEPSFGSESASLLYIIQGAEAFNRGASDFSQVGLEAPGPRLLRITLERPAPAFLSMMNASAWLPVPVAVIARYGSVVRRDTPWARPGRLVSNGPFVLDRWVPGQEIRVVRSATYWDAARVRLRALRFECIDSLDAEERAFRAGQLHVTDALPPSRVEAWRRDNPDVLRMDPLLGTYFLRLNVRRPGLDTPEVRRALSLSVDRRALVERVLRSGQTPAARFTAPGLPGYPPEPQAVFDPAEARRLLAESGHPAGAGLPPLTLLYNTSESHRVIAEALQEMWRRELGLDVRLENQELKGVLDARRLGQYDLLRSSWIADYADPAAFLDCWRADSANNFTGWSSSEYDGLVFAAERTAGAPARNALFARAEAVLQKEAPILPLYHYTHVYLLDARVRGWYPTLLDHHPYKGVWLEAGAGASAGPQAGRSGDPLGD